MTSALKDIFSIQRAIFVHDDHSHEHLEDRVIIIYVCPQGLLLVMAPD